MIHTGEKQYHIPAGAGEVGGYCVIPGDPGRCEKIAAYLDNPYLLGQNREFNIYCGTLSGVPVSICSTGIGGPSAAIAVEELAACGVHTFIRVGTCGGIASKVKAGDIVIASGAVRQDGTSHEYAPPEYPAVPDTDVLFALRRACQSLQLDSHTGVVQSKDSFYGQHSPQRMPVSASLIQKWEAWTKLGVLASEMEAAALFTVGAALGVRTGAVFMTVWNQNRIDAGMDDETAQNHDTDRAIRAAVEAVRLLVASDGMCKTDNS